MVDLAKLPLTIPEALQIVAFLSSEIRDLLALAKSKGADPAQIDALLAAYEDAHAQAMAAKATY